MIIKALKKGTTLIEVLVASLIMVIAIGALLMSYIPRRAIIEASKQNTVVQSLFEREFERIRTLSTQDDLKKYLYKSYTSSTNNEPYSLSNPLLIAIDGVNYNLYYELEAVTNKPYTLKSLGSDSDPNLKADGLGAKAIQVHAFISWVGINGDTEIRDAIFRGNYAVDI